LSGDRGSEFVSTGARAGLAGTTRELSSIDGDAGAVVSSAPLGFTGEHTLMWGLLRRHRSTDAKQIETNAEVSCQGATQGMSASSKRQAESEGAQVLMMFREQRNIEVMHVSIGVP
jgi:hypothetical protein